MDRSAVATALCVAALSLTGCASSSSGSGAQATPASPTGAPTDIPSPSVADTTAPAGAGAALKISGFRYTPTPLTVSPGQVVSATNSDSAEHTVSSDKDGLFVSDDIGRGKTVTFKAPTTPGTYTFHCAYHSTMHGTLVVK